MFSGLVGATPVFGQKYASNKPLWHDYALQG